MARSSVSEHPHPVPASTACQVSSAKWASCEMDYVAGPAARQLCNEAATAAASCAAIFCGSDKFEISAAISQWTNRCGGSARYEWVVINKLRSQAAAFELMRAIKCRTHTHISSSSSSSCVCCRALVPGFWVCVLPAFGVQLPSSCLVVVAAHKCAAELNACFSRCRHCRIVAVKATL